VAEVRTSLFRSPVSVDPGLAAVATMAQSRNFVAAKVVRSPFFIRSILAARVSAGSKS
jgi:hypothetical protein